jgi:hypothetical protein
MDNEITNKLRRVLHLEEESHHSEIAIEIGYPEKHGEEFGCHVVIKSHKLLDFDNIIFGVDPMQAMTLALRFVRCMIMDHEFYRSGRLYWLEPGNDFDPV